jgi:hypothetical protein
MHQNHHLGAKIAPRHFGIKNCVIIQKNGKIRKNFAVFSLYSPRGGFHAEVRGILPLFIFIPIKITLTNH